MSPQGFCRAGMWVTVVSKLLRARFRAKAKVGAREGRAVPLRDACRRCSLLASDRWVLIHPGGGSPRNSTEGGVQVSGSPPMLRL